jgi:hypothetical protein
VLDEGDLGARLSPALGEVILQAQPVFKYCPYPHDGASSQILFLMREVAIRHALQASREVWMHGSHILTGLLAQSFPSLCRCGREWVVIANYAYLGGFSCRKTSRAEVSTVPPRPQRRHREPGKFS